MMMLAAENVIDRIVDHPWGRPFEWDVLGMKITLMSSGIAAMILVALLLLAIILPLARRYRAVPKGGRNVLEIIVIFARDMIARPALHEKAYRFLPFLLTLFVFVLGMNLIGLLPLESLSDAVGMWLGLHGKGVGGTPTAILAVCGGLAAMTLVMVLMLSLWTQIRLYHHKKHWPLLACIILSPLLWINSLAPPMPGMMGVVLKLPMTFVELVGVLARCAALMIRLFANMISGHTLVAVFLMLVISSLISWMQTSAPHVFYVAPVCILASVAIDLLELLVAGIQAYVFTFLTAIFIGLAMEESH